MSQRCINSSLETKEKLLAVKENLHESFIQRRMKTYTYQALRNIYKQRKNHALPQWKMFCDKIKTLPYSKQLIIAQR